jgi:hypothetical protein
VLCTARLRTHSGTGKWVREEGLGANRDAKQTTVTAEVTDCHSRSHRHSPASVCGKAPPLPAWGFQLMTSPAGIPPYLWMATAAKRGAARARMPTESAHPTSEGAVLPQRLSWPGPSGGLGPRRFQTPWLQLSQFTFTLVGAGHPNPTSGLFDGWRTCWAQVQGQRVWGKGEGRVLLEEQENQPRNHVRLRNHSSFRTKYILFRVDGIRQYWAKTLVPLDTGGSCL